MWFKIFLPVIFKSTISVSCLSNHGDNEFTSWLAHSPLLFACQNSTERNWSPLLTTTWATPIKVTFHVEIRFHKPDILWRTQACVHGHSALTLAVVIHAVFVSSWGIRQCKLPCHAEWQTVSSGVHVCLLILSKQKWCHLGNPCIGIGQFIAFAIYLDWFYKMINSCFNFLMLDGGVYHSGNRQNLRKTKWRPFCWNSRFGTFWCSTRSITML